MKTFIVVLSIILLSSYAVAGPSHAGRIGDRQWRQQERIQRGILTGQLTRKEAAKLIREQHKIRYMRERAWRDHRLSYKERRRIIKRLDKADRHIVMLKNNRYHRPGWYPPGPPPWGWPFSQAWP